MCAAFAAGCVSQRRLALGTNANKLVTNAEGIILELIRLEEDVCVLRSPLCDCVLLYLRC